MRTLLIALTVSTLLACAEENAETVNLRLNHYQQTAIGEGQLLAYLVQEGNDIGTENWSYFYGGIGGFTYELGYLYDLKVEKTPVDNPPADGSSIRYTLRKVISKQPVDDTVSFEVRLKSVERSNPPSFVTGNLASGFELLSTTPIDCDVLCSELDQQLATEDEVTGVFTHAAGAIRLIDLKTE